MNAVETEKALSALAEQHFVAQKFPYTFAEAFGNNPTKLKHLRSGASNNSDLGNVLQTKNIHIIVSEEYAITATLAALKVSPSTVKERAKFMLAADGNELEAEDLNTCETTACAYKAFPDHSRFFLPLAMNKVDLW